jgi:hypothetical protein
VIEQSHATRRSRRHDNGTEPHYQEIWAAWRWNRSTLPGDPGGKTMKQSHTTRRSGWHDDGTDPRYQEIKEERL